jgi:hypothetical protein
MISCISYIAYHTALLVAREQQVSHERLNLLPSFILSIFTSLFFSHSKEMIQDGFDLRLLHPCLSTLLSWAAVCYTK